MRPLFLVLVLANLVAFAVEFDLLGLSSDRRAPPAQLNAERLRLVRDASAPSSSAPGDGSP